MINLSVIIPTRNRAVLLSKTLTSIVNQTLDQDFFEVIICDNNSTDATFEEVNSFQNKFKHFQYIKTIEPGLHVGRNKGFQEAKGEILVYGDDDIEALPEWLHTIYKVFKETNAVLVGGKNLPKWEINPPLWALKMWEPNKENNRIVGCYSIIDLGEDIKEIDPYYVFGCNFAVRREIIEATRGFHPDAMPQEMIEFRGDGESYVSEYIKKKGYKTIYHPKASVYHFVSKERLTIDYLWIRGYNQGISDSFTNLRKSKTSNFREKINLNNLIEKLVRKIINLAKNGLSKSLGQSDLHQEAINAGHREGYSFHRKRLKENPQLRKWVLKEEYF